MAVQLVHPGSEAVVEAGRRAIQDSSLYPLLVRPWSVNKVLSLLSSAASVLSVTGYLRLTPHPGGELRLRGLVLVWFCILLLCLQVTVSLDACLVILLLINIAIFAPLLLGSAVQLARLSYRHEDSEISKMINWSSGQRDFTKMTVSPSVERVEQNCRL